MRTLLSILCLAPLSLFAQDAKHLTFDWKSTHRILVATDFFQTEQFIKTTPGVYEKNPFLRGSSIETALNMAIHCEAYIWLVDRLPRNLRPVAGTALNLLRLIDVGGNARLGAPQPFYVPLYTTRF
jgi:hypothetical protein